MTDAKRHALLVDEDDGCLEMLCDLARISGFSPSRARTLDDAQQLIEALCPRVALIDASLIDPFTPGTFRRLLRSDLILVVTSTLANVEAAVSAVRAGAYEYMVKPLDQGRLRTIFSTVRSNGTASPTAREGAVVNTIFGRSPAMQQVYELIERAGPTNASVLITGESGTGKDLVAQALHQASPRAQSEFLALNCGAISPNLFESELFGHERGSFTGANYMRRGYFECANGGTLFLDEITEMPLELQSKLLRVLENGTVTRVGRNQPIRVDVRIIAATNRDPEEAVGQGILRQDLLYRLNVFPLNLPPLRERKEDIEELAGHFLELLNCSSKTRKTITASAIARLCSHQWPGNVRELRNAIHRAFILADDAITPEHLPSPHADTCNPVNGHDLRIRVGASIFETERRLILATLDHCNGNKRKAADILGISLKTLYNRLHAYGEI